MFFFQFVFFALCLFIQLAQKAQRFFVVRKKQLHKHQGYRYRNDLFGSKGDPQKSKISAPHRHHPGDAQPRAQPQHDIRPAVGYHPADAEAKKKTGVHDEHYYFFRPFFGYFPNPRPCEFFFVFQFVFLRFLTFGLCFYSLILSDFVGLSRKKEKERKKGCPRKKHRHLLKK